MRHRKSYIEAVERALTRKTSSGEIAIEVIARNWVREAMDPESPNYKFALAELNQYVLGRPEEHINHNISTGVRVEPTPSSLAMMGIGSMVVQIADEYGDTVPREVRALLPSPEEEAENGG